MKKDYEDLYAVTNVLLYNAIKSMREFLQYNKSDVEDSEKKFLKAVANEPKPIRKYRLSTNINILLDCSRDSKYTIGGCNLNKLFQDHKFGLVYTGGRYIFPFEHFIFNMDKDDIIIEVFIGESGKTPEDLGSNVVGRISINRKNISKDSILFDYTTIANNHITKYEKSKKFNTEGIYLIQSGLHRVLDKAGITMESFIKIVRDNSEFVSNINNETEMRVIEDCIREDYGKELCDLFMSTMYKYRFIYRSFKEFLFLMTSDIKVETFESALSGKVKNPPTQFEDPDTGRRNQGIIVVDRLYDTEINIDCPFGVRGHWRNQYYGKDTAGNPIHKKIFIEAFEKKRLSQKSNERISRKQIKTKREEDLYFFLFLFFYLRIFFLYIS